MEAEGSKNISLLKCQTETNLREAAENENSNQPVNWSPVNDCTKKQPVSKGFDRKSVHACITVHVQLAGLTMLLMLRASVAGEGCCDNFIRHNKL